MGDDLRFLSRLVVERAQKLQSSLPPFEGRGSSLVKVGLTICGQISNQAQTLGALSNLSEPVVRAHERTLLRAKQKLDLLHQVIALWGGDIGRTDVPIGLLYLVDELIRDLLPLGADPLLHLGDAYMYTTLAVLEAAEDLMRPKDFPHPHPVVFNVPGLSPANAMLAPILAHEVGHTSWGQSVGLLLETAMDKAAVQNVLRAAQSAGAPVQALIDGFNSWMKELMCDALAAVLTGPSFLFASAVFLPAPSQGTLGAHPYPRDRIRFTLRILDEHGWTPVLSELVPDLLAWCRGLTNDLELSGDVVETALRECMTIIEPAMIAVANDVSQNRVTSEKFAAHQKELFDYLDLEIPPVYADKDPSSPWLIILGGWLHELVGRGDAAIVDLPEIAGNAELNRFLLKTVELSGIARFWG